MRKDPPVHKRTEPRETHKPPRRGEEPARPELTRELVGSKFKQTSRLYEAYKAKNGARLEQDWNNLATFIQFKMTDANLDDAVRRMDAFAAKLRE